MSWLRAAVALVVCASCGAEPSSALTVSAEDAGRGASDALDDAGSTDAGDVDAGVGPLDTGIEPIPGPCRYEISPASLSFGVIPRDANLARTIELRNWGPSNCWIEDVRLDGPSQVELDGPEHLPWLLPPGAALPLAFRLGPGPCETGLSAQLVIVIRDLPRQALSIPIGAAGPDRTMPLGPPIVWEDVRVGCESTRSVTFDPLYPGASATMSIERGFEYGGPRQFEVVAGETVDAQVIFRPEAAGTYEGFLSVTYEIPVPDEPCTNRIVGFFELQAVALPNLDGACD